jgi:uncharacterized PurR-regulated membrane protein YhhQ (DUF165 family)
MRRKTIGACALILASIILANLISSHFGPSASIYNAFFLVGVVLSTKDFLYDAWGRNRVRNMALLIAAGSILSYLCAHWFAGSTPPAIVQKIAVGSFVAFAVSELWDTIVYALLKDRPWLERSNTSNIVGAFLDSGVFVWIAFGWTWPIVFGQFTAKVAGGFVWSLVIEHTQTKTVDPEAVTA